MRYLPLTVVVCVMVIGAGCASTPPQAPCCLVSLTAENLTPSDVMLRVRGWTVYDPAEFLVSEMVPPSGMISWKFPPIRDGATFFLVADVSVDGGSTYHPGEVKGYKVNGAHLACSAVVTHREIKGFPVSTSICR